MTGMLPRIRPYPVLATNSLDYQSDHKYETRHEIHEGTDSQLVLEHQLTENNLVAQLLQEGKAQFSCTFTSTSSAYREVFTESGQLTTHKQIIELDRSRATYPLFCQSAIITVDEIFHVVAPDTDGLHEFWHGASLVFPKGAILAITPFWRANDPLRSILSVKKARDGVLPDGCFEVKEAEENGFYFEMTVAPDLYGCLRNPGNATAHRDSIYSTALAQGFEILQTRYKEKEAWTPHHNLRGLFEMLTSRKLSTWMDDEFSPNRTVAKFHPHIIVTGIDEITD